VDGAGLVGPAAQAEAAGIRHVQPGDDIEERGLAGPVGPDEAVDLAAANADADAGERLQAAETLVHARHFEDHVRLRGGIRFHRLGHHPRSGASGPGAPPWMPPTGRPAVPPPPGPEPSSPSPGTGARSPCRGGGHSPLGRMSMITTIEPPKSSMRKASVGMI